MSHGQTLPRIDAKLSYVEREKPKWYQGDERTLAVYERHLDDQIKKIDRAKPEKKRARFELPAGIMAAERGQ